MVKKGPAKDSKHSSLEQQVQSLTEALQRERADSENIRRQHQEQSAMVRNVVKINVVRELLPVIDNFQRSLKHVPKDLESNDYVKGVQGIVKQFEDVLAKMGVQRIKTVGEVFDPRFHEAVSMEEGEGSVETIVEEVQPGYLLNNEVVRHAMVKVRMQ